VVYGNYPEIPDGSIKQKISKPQAKDKQNGSKPEAKPQAKDKQNGSKPQAKDKPGLSKLLDRGCRLSTSIGISGTGYPPQLGLPAPETLSIHNRVIGYL